MFSKGVMYLCDIYPTGVKSVVEESYRESYVGKVFGNRSSPSECFSLYSFWLGRDSDVILEWPVNDLSKPIDRDHSFLYGG